ncbi:MAG: helix-turn-helix domain-containing protein [Actinomycetota bacterium]|nr:helix-turn-helix domain-containing protein [Actinomycetota bacterium]
MALQPAPSALRTVELIRLMAEHPGQVFAVAELARRTGQSRATCQAVLLALEPSQWVHRSRDGYSLGAGLISVGASAQRGAAIVGLLRSAVRDLHDEVGCEILGYIPAGDQLINVSRVGPATPLSATVVEGQAFPLVPPWGLAFVAWDESELAAWMARAPNTGRSAPDRLRKAADIVRDLGYSVLLDPATRREFRSSVEELSEARRQFVASALAHDGLVVAESEPAIRVSLLSAPVFGADGRVHGLLAVVFDVTHYARLAELATSLKSACRELSGRLGAPLVEAQQERPAG